MTLPGERTTEDEFESECASSPAFVFQDSASEGGSSSLASPSVNQILTRCTKAPVSSSVIPAKARGSRVPIPSSAGAFAQISPSSPYYTNKSLQHTIIQQSSSFSSQTPHTTPQLDRSFPLSPTPADVSSITSSSMASGNTSSEGDTSRNSPSSASSSPSCASPSRSWNTQKQHPTRPDNEVCNLSTSSTESPAPGFLAPLFKSQAKIGVSSSKPLLPCGDRLEEETIPSTSWANSPSASGISDDLGDTRPPIPPARNNCEGGKEVCKESFTTGAFSSLKSQRNNSMDNSSLALESASGKFSETTGFYSEATQVIRNTSGIPLARNQRDLGRGLAPMDSLHPPRLPENHWGRICTVDEDPSQTQNSRLSSKRSFIRGGQRWVIGSLVVLFVFGLITLIVSFTLSRNQSGEMANPTTETNTDDEGFDTNPILDDDTLLDSDTESVNSTFSPPPTTPPSTGEGSASLADALPSNAPTSRPSFSPSLSPSLATISEPPSSNSISVSGGATFTYFPSQIPTPILTSSLTVGTTTTSTTDILADSSPLLSLDTNLTEEAQLWGESNGEAAGSSTALSGNGQIFLMGSPNSGDDTGSERAGSVHVYERTIDPSSQAEWTLRTTLMGTEEMSQLGFSLATNYDGNIVVVSEPTADSSRGRVTIYEWQPEQQSYEAQQVLRGTDTSDHFGISMSLSSDGSRLAVGSPYHSNEATSELPASTLRGQVQVFEFVEGLQAWEVMGTANSDTLMGPASLDWFGWSVSLTKDGQVLAVGAPRNTEFGGYVQCFRYDGKVWGSLGPPIMNVIPPVKLDDRFGHSTSITNTGTRPDANDSVTRVAVGAPWKDMGDTLNSGLVAVYEWSELTSSWSLNANGALGSILAEKEPGFYHQLGYSIKMEDDLIAVGVPGWDNRRGMVNLFWLPHAFDGSTNYAGDESPFLELTTPLTGETVGDDFGFSISLILQRSPSSVMVACGAIMVSTTETEAIGYSKLYQRGQFP